MTSVNPLDRRDWQASDMGVAWLRYAASANLLTRTDPIITFVHGWGRVAGIRLDPYRYFVSNLWIRQGRRTYTPKLIWYVVTRVNQNVTTTYASLAASTVVQSTSTSPFYTRSSSISQSASGSNTSTSVKFRNAPFALSEPPAPSEPRDVFVVRY